MDKLLAIYLMIAMATVITVVVAYIAIGVVAIHFISKFW